MLERGAGGFLFFVCVERKLGAISRRRASLRVSSVFVELH